MTAHPAVDPVALTRRLVRIPSSDPPGGELAMAEAVHAVLGEFGIESELDEFRPGSARARLIEESIPVWAIVGYIGAISGTTDPDDITDEVIAETGTAYAISREAVEAAVLYCREHRGAIDGLLEANEMLPKQ